MSKDFDDIPFKYDWHKNKHTLRYRRIHYVHSTNYKLECDRTIKKDEIPVTTIDDLFDDNFINSYNWYGYSKFQSRPLNKEHLWTNLENTLKNTSIQTVKKWDPSNGVVCQTFNIPVKNYVLKDTKINMELSWLKWNNQYYDPNYLYTFDGSSDDSTGMLKKYCQLKWVEQHIDNMESMGKKVFIQKKKKNKLIQTKECYYEIDLGELKNIQSIVTFGKYPNKRPFPKRKGKYGDYYDTNEDSYVKSYSVAYKDCQTQKWVQYKQFDGNVNSFTPKINSVDIYYRYIRIKPLEYIKTKSMIIYVYVSKNTIQNNYDSEDEEVVKYTLIPPVTNEFRYDGYGERCPSPDWVYAQHYKTVRKDKIKSIIKEQLENLDDFDL
jgi:hypothetical protein